MPSAHKNLGYIWINFTSLQYVKDQTVYTIEHRYNTVQYDTTMPYVGNMSNL